MTNTASRRLKNELNMLMKSDTMEIIVNEKDFNNWIIIFDGPLNTIYENYKFKIDIKFPIEYPFAAPRIKFITPIQHINVNSSGDICLDILNRNKWTPQYYIKNIVLSIITLLENPNFDDPFNTSLASMYIENIEEYEKFIIDSCNKYAISKN